MNRLFLLLILTGISGVSFAQREVNMFFMENVHQSTYFNPAATPENKVSIGLPGMNSVYIGFAHPSFSFNQLHNGDEWLIRDILDNKLKRRNLIGVNSYVDLFSLRIKIKNNYYSFTNGLRTNVSFTYPGDLFRLAWYGNASQSEFDLTGLGFEASAYTEHGFGMTHERKQFTAGAKIKFLNGIGNVKLQNNDLYIRSKRGQYDNYGIEVKGDMSLLTAGYANLAVDDSIRSGDTTKLFSNWGIALDLGMKYHLTDKIDLVASLTDIGFIRWKSATQEYNVTAQKAFEGFEVGLSEAMYGELDTDSLVEALTDSLAESISNSSKRKNYTTTPIANLYLGGTYQLFQRTQLHVLMNMSFFKGVRSSLTIGAQQELRRVLSFSITNTIQYNKLFNLGLGLMLKPGPVQFYFAADNISALFHYQEDREAGVIIPDRLNNFNLRFGINLVFGKVKPQAKLQTLLD